MVCLSPRTAVLAVFCSLVAFPARAQTVTCTGIAAYSPSTIFNPGDKTVYNGKLYQANVAIWNTPPDYCPPCGYWTLLGTCGTTDTTPPSVPSGLASPSQTTTSITLAWSASTDNAGGSGVKDYLVLRGGSQVGTATSTSFTDAGLAPDTTFAYSVQARDNASNVSAASAALAVKTLANPSCSVIPSVPTGLAAPSKTSTSVSLSWNAAVAGTGCTVQYRVFRNGAQVTQTAATTFTASGLTASTTYSFSVAAIDEAGASAQSAALSVQTSAAPTGGVSVLTRNHDNRRSGANLAESVLTTANVNASQFGKQFQLQVDDQVYAGVLYVAGLAIAGGTHDVVYVATVNNSVYAYDAATPGPPLWWRNFNGSGRPTLRSEVGSACGTYRDFSGNIGIVGTPVIDDSTKTMYFVTRAVEAGTTVQRLRALDITTGNDRAGSPIVIQASVPGSGDGAVGGNVLFNPQTQNQRPALALAAGTVYIGWASFCDTRPYHGWMLAYDATSLTQVGVFNTTPNASQAGIWMAGGGPVFDAAGSLLVPTGNGDWDGSTSFGESLLKLAPRTLGRQDYFTPANFTSLNNADLDLGSAGPIVVPGTSFIVTGGKEGKAYLLNGASLGQTASGDSQIPQSFQAVSPAPRPSASHHLHNGMVAWTSPQGANLYAWGENDFLRGFRWNPSTQRLTTPATLVGSVLPPIGMPGGLMSVSAQGSAPGSGIVWATTPRSGDANQAVVPGVLYAFNAETLALLWSSTGANDDALNFAKGAPPVVANGRIYVASLSNVVSVYGLRSAAPPQQNLALAKPATGSAACAANEGPDRAVNGTTSGGNADKWCSTAAGTKFLQVDLGSSMSVGQIVIEHAGAGGESFDFNTKDYNVQVSADGSTFTTVATLTGNIQSITTHNIPATNARYVRLNVVTPTQTTDGAARIYELAVYASRGITSPPPTIDPSAWYTVVNQTSGLCADAAGVGTTNGTSVQQWTCVAGAQNQQWQFRPTDGGFYNVVPRHASALSWDVTGGTGATGNSVKVELWTAGGSAATNQQWMPVALDGAMFKFIARHSGRCLDVPGASTNTGVQLQQYECNGTGAQAFAIAAQP